jgi:hypothetical protein
MVKTKCPVASVVGQGMASRTDVGVSGDARQIRLLVVQRERFLWLTRWTNRTTANVDGLRNSYFFEGFDNEETRNLSSPPAENKTCAPPKKRRKQWLGRKQRLRETKNRVRSLLLGYPK